MDLVSVSRRLTREVSSLAFGEPVSVVYNPLHYARAPHEDYLRRYGRGRREVLLLGMNPGPYGMVQTGVPFGDPGLVREWLGIEGRVSRPVREHHRRPVQGFASPRSEVSGRRLWSLARARFHTPERFFARFFVWNYCPLAFLEASGKNRTPDRLPRAERAPLFAACDRALAGVVDHLRPTVVVGVGAFAAARAREVRARHTRVCTLLHPSPASPRANRGWEAEADRALRRLMADLRRSSARRADTPED